MDDFDSIVNDPDLDDLWELDDDAALYRPFDWHQDEQGGPVRSRHHPAYGHWQRYVSLETACGEVGASADSTSSLGATGSDAAIDSAIRLPSVGHCDSMPQGQAVNRASCHGGSCGASPSANVQGHSHHDDWLDQLLAWQAKPFAWLDTFSLLAFTVIFVAVILAAIAIVV